MIKKLLILIFVLSGYILSAQTGNTATGTDALYWISTGDYNTVTGYEVSFYTSTGSGNTVDGYQAFYDNLSGSYNSIYGFQAGYYATGDSCVFLGMKAGYDETGSHKLYIENTDASTPLIYGEFDNDYLRFNGIATIQTSGQILDGSDTLIDADAVFDYIMGGGGYWDKTGNYVYLRTIGDSVGIGTATPGAKLDVAGHIWQTSTGQSVFLGEGAGAVDDLATNRCVAVGYHSQKLKTTGDNVTSVGAYSLKSIISSGNCTAIGAYCLQNATGSGLTGLGTSAGQNITIGQFGTYLGDQTTASAVDVNREIVIGYQAIGQGSNTATIGDDNITDIYLNENGTAKLHASTLGISGQIIDNSDSLIDADAVYDFVNGLIPSAVESGTANGQMLFWDTDAWKHSETSELFWDDANKRVGIGTNSPPTPLTLILEDTETLQLRSAAAGLGNEIGIGFRITSTDNAANYAEITAERTNDPSNTDTDLIFKTRTAGSLGERMRIGVNGNVGIGDATPDAKLDIEGAGVILTSGQILNGSDSLVDADAVYDYVNDFAVDSNFWSRTGNYTWNKPLSDSVGIGTATPSEKFEVSGSAKITGKITLEAAGIIGTPGLILNGSDSLVDADAVYDHVVANKYWTLSSHTLYPVGNDDTLGSSTYVIPKAYIDTIIGGSTVDFPEGLNSRGGWAAWSPSLTWATNTPTVNTAVYRYSRINSTIHFIIDINGTNNTGGNVTGLELSLPVTPKDVNMQVIVTGANTVDGSIKQQGAYVDAENAAAISRKLYFVTFSWSTGTSADFYVEGFYEIEK